MSLFYSVPLLILALLLVVSLAFYAGRLLFLLNQQSKRQQQVRSARMDSIIQSIRTIAAATSQDQCNISEASIRISRLLAALPVREIKDYTAVFPALHELQSRIADLATHDARQKLSKIERKEQDTVRELHEAQLQEKILAEVLILKNFEL